MMGGLLATKIRDASFCQINIFKLVYLFFGALTAMVISAIFADSLRERDGTKYFTNIHHYFFMKSEEPENGSVSRPSRISSVY